MKEEESSFADWQPLLAASRSTPFPMEAYVITVS
jgi:hypothetical protein